MVLYLHKFYYRNTFINRGWNVTTVWNLHTILGRKSEKISNFTVPLINMWNAFLLPLNVSVVKHYKLSFYWFPNCSVSRETRFQWDGIQQSELHDLVSHHCGKYDHSCFVTTGYLIPNIPKYSAGLWCSYSKQQVFLVEVLQIMPVSCSDA